MIRELYWLTGLLVFVVLVIDTIAIVIYWRAKR